jgi:F-type H+-transporting ATPase subunit delta
MRNPTIAKRYAKALVDSIQLQEEYLEITGQLGQFLELLKRDVAFRSGMETVLFAKKQKRDILSTIRDQMGLEDKASNFLMVLIEENRLIFLEEILKGVAQFWYEKKGIEKFNVLSAIPLDQGQKKRLITQLEAALKKKVEIENHLDPSLIAGIKLQRGSVFYDFSIAGNLKKLKQELTGVTIPESFIDIGVEDANKG